VGILPSHQSARLSRHGDVLRLAFRHARPGLFDQAGLEAELQDLEAASGDPHDEAERARRFAADLEGMGPTFVKLGQVLSTRADLLPQPYLDALTRLQDQVEPIPVAEVRAVIEEDLGMRVKDLFQSFDDEPLAAASIAQVHRARLGDGREVAVKVQRPGIADTVRQDLEVLRDLARVIDATTEVGRRFAFVDFLDTFRTSFVAELDFRTEADNLHTFAELLAEREHLDVPRPIDRLVTRRVLTMDFIEGRRVTDIGPLARHDFDGEQLADELVRAYIDQILVKGVVHADPHPGNVLLTPDGKLVLLDLGMVTRLGHRIRRHLLDLTLAIAEERADHVVEVLEVAGTRLGDYDRSTLEAHVAELLSRHATSTAATLDTGSVLLAVSRACGMADLRPPAEIAMVGKALLHLDEVTRSLAPDFLPNETIVDHTGALLRHQVGEGASRLRVARTALDSARFMESLPRHADRILSDLADGSLTLKIDALDEDELLRGLEKASTRLTVGVVLAGTVVGAAQAMRTESHVKILGAPAVPMLFFVPAAIGGMVLVAHVLVTDRKDRAKRRRAT